MPDYDYDEYTRRQEEWEARQEEEAEEMESLVKEAMQKLRSKRKMIYPGKKYKPLSIPLSGFFFDLGPFPD
jgi:hypothetical protein